MMKQYSDRAMILSRVDYGERDRILTLLCREQGKVSVLAKGVRAEKSRLAGGIELLSESEVSFIDGKSNLKTLTGARLKTHFGNLSGSIGIMQLAFDWIKITNNIAEEGHGQDHYLVLLQALTALNDKAYDPRIVDIWFNLQVLKLAGSEPNLGAGQKEESTSFIFNHDKQEFAPGADGVFTRNDLKLLRLTAHQSKPPKIHQELGSEDRLQSLVRTLLKSNLTEV